MSTAVPQKLRWHRRMEARVIMGIALLVTFSLGGLMVAASRVALALLSLPRGIVPAVAHAENYFAERPAQ